MQYIIYILFLIVSVVGLAEIIHILQLSLLTKKGKNNKILFCVLNDKFPDLKLRYVAEQRQWHGNSFADKIIAVSHIEDEKLLEKCMRIAAKSDILLINHQEIRDNQNLET